MESFQSGYDTWGGRLLLASAILAGINMHFSYYLMFSDSTQTQSAACTGINDTQPLNFDEWNQQILSKWETCFSTRYNFSLQWSTSKMLQSLVVLVKWYTPKLWIFFTIMADNDGEPRTTLQSLAKLHGLQYLKDSDRTLSSFEIYPLVRCMFRRFNVVYFFIRGSWTVF